MATILQKVVRAMVLDSQDGVYDGSPRKRLMEKYGSSSGPLYRGLKQLGIVRKGKGKTARWFIPKSVRDANSKE